MHHMYLFYLSPLCMYVGCLVVFRIYVTLKLERTNLNNSVLGTSTAAIFSQMIILSMHLLPRINDMIDFICMGPVDLPGARRKRQNKK